MTEIQINADLSVYAAFLSEVKDRIRAAQVRANFAVNRELITLYRQIGKMISERQETAGWGAKVIDHLARDPKAFEM
jgi:hypothetical protein